MCYCRSRPVDAVEFINKSFYGSGGKICNLFQMSCRSMPMKGDTSLNNHPKIVTIRVSRMTHEETVI